MAWRDLSGAKGLPVGMLGRSTRAAVALSLIAACAGTTATDAGSHADSDGEGTDAVAATDVGEEVVAPCASGLLGPGDYAFTVQHAGLERSYLLHVPAGHQPATPAPVIFNLHGFGRDGEFQAERSQLAAAAADGGYVLVHPDGYETSWNAGACCGDAVGDDVDDVAAVRAMVADVAERVCVAPGRIFATGMSNGGAMAHRLGCDAADVFRAVVGISGGLQLAPEACRPTRPVPVLHLHGTEDSVLPWDGGGIFGALPVDGTVAAWTAANACVDPEPAVTWELGPTRCVTWSQCTGDGELTLCTVEGMGHCWPGEPSCLYHYPPELVASELVVTFFDRFLDHAP